MQQSDLLCVRSYCVGGDCLFVVVQIISYVVFVEFVVIGQGEGDEWYVYRFRQEFEFFSCNYVVCQEFGIFCVVYVDFFVILFLLFEQFEFQLNL